jgi:hypothetical protein
MPGRLAFVLSLLLVPLKQTEDVKVLGSSGGVRFVAITATIAKTDDQLRRTAHTVCADTPVCGVRFWVGEAHAARHLPMTESQARYQVAAYAINKNTGVDEFSCKPTVDRTPPCTPAN